MIKLVRNYKYDNKYTHIKLFKNKAEQNTYFDSLDSLYIEDNNYIKEHNSFKIGFDYDYLVSLGVNYLIFNNGFKDMYCFITSKEYISSEVTQINFEVDVLNTYLFDFEIKKSFVERKRCSLDEITDYDEGLEIGEHEIIENNEVITKEYTYFAMFNGFRDYIISTDGLSYKDIPLVDTTRPITKIDGITYPLAFMALEDTYITEIFNKYLIDHPSLVGIIRMPKCTYTKVNFAIPVLNIEGGKIIKNHLGCQYMVNNINSVDVTSPAFTINKASITDFYPYTYYTLTDGESEPLIMKPQNMGNSVSIIGKYAISHTPVERFYPSIYKGDTTGTIYNITNTSIMMLPTGTNAGLEILSSGLAQFEQSKNSLIANTLVGGVTAIGGVASGNAMGVMAGLTLGSQAISSLTSVKEHMARVQDLELTPTSIKSYGTPSTRSKFNTNKVRLIKYTIQDKYKKRINNFIERYGNKYNNYTTINIKNYKGYIKFIDVDIDSGIDNIYLRKIIEILERGIYIE